MPALQTFEVAPNNYGPSAKSAAKLVAAVGDHGTHGQDVCGDGGAYSGAAHGGGQVRAGGRARSVQCWRAPPLSRRSVPLPVRVCVSLTRCAAFAYRHCSWAAAEEEWEECRGDSPRPKPAAGRRVKQKGGWTEEEDGRLARCVFGKQGGGCAAARAWCAKPGVATSGRWTVVSPGLTRCHPQPGDRARRALLDAGGQPAGQPHREAGARPPRGGEAKPGALS